MSNRSVQFWIIVLVTCTGLALSSCDNYLEDVSPSSAIPLEEGFRSAEDLDVFLRGAYFSLAGSLGDRFMIILPDLSTEDLIAPVSCFLQSKPFDRNAITPDNRHLAEMWRGAYRTINQANVLVAETRRLLDNNDISQEEGDRIEGEARFLRAVTYFQLARLFANPVAGDDASAVPMPLSGVKYADQLESLPRSTIAEVYSQIRTDLSIAADLLVNIEIRDGRASRLAAQAFLAEVEFQQGNYTAALGHTQEVIASSQFTLVSPPERFFDDEGTAEEIWSLIRDQGEGGNLWWDTQTEICDHVVFPHDLYERTFDRILSAEQKIEVSVNGWTVSDLRFTNLTNADTAGDWRSEKYGRQDADQPVMRYAEILLMHAECLARTGGVTQNAIDYLNMVRERSLEVRDANGNVLSDDDVMNKVIRYQPEDFNNDADALIEAIILERQVELLLEGNRFHDLMRLGRKINGIPAESCLLRWPIPQAELDANDNISQMYPEEC